jgi:ureidoglycolate lyase
LNKSPQSETGTTTLAAASAAATAPYLLRTQPLTAAAFAPYGQVVEAPEGAPHRLINAGLAKRFDSAARIDTGAAGGLPLISIFRARPQAHASGNVDGGVNADADADGGGVSVEIAGTPPAQIALQLLERHSLGSQLFMPLSPQSFVVVVAPAGPPPTAQALRAFLASPGQGVNLARGTWHHPLLVLQPADFLVIERQSPAAQEDCELHPLQNPAVWLLL